MSSDLLGDIFEPQLGGNKKDDTFDFDPDGGSHTSGVVDMFSGSHGGDKAGVSQPEIADMFGDSHTGGTQPSTEDMFKGSSGLASPAPSAGGSTGGNSCDPVDQDELRRRIRGEGSEKTSSLQKIRAAASGAAGGAVARIRGGVLETSRWKLAIGLLLLLALGGGGYVWWRRSVAASLDDSVIVNEAAKTPAKPKIRMPSDSSATASKRVSYTNPLEEEIAHKAKASAADEAAAEAAAAGDDSGEDTPPSRASRSGAAGGSASNAKEFASLTYLIKNSNAQVLSELAALRKEVASLKAARQGSDSPTDTQSRVSSARGADSVGEVHVEKPRRPSSYTGTRGAAARARAAAAAASAADDDGEDKPVPSWRSAAARARAAAARRDDDGPKVTGRVRSASVEDETDDGPKVTSGDDDLPNNANLD